MSKPIKQMTMDELREEILLLTILKGSLLRCVEEEDYFNDDASMALLEDTEDQLSACQAEEYERKSRAVTNCS